MFAQKIVNSWKKPFGFAQAFGSEAAQARTRRGKEKRDKKRADLVAEQVKQMLQTSDQKLILMVRG